MRRGTTAMLSVDMVRSPFHPVRHMRHMDFN